jgi:hypothetical protein
MICDSTSMNYLGAKSAEAIEVVKEAFTVVTKLTSLGKLAQQQLSPIYLHTHNTVYISWTCKTLVLHRNICDQYWFKETERSFQNH